MTSVSLLAEKLLKSILINIGVDGQCQGDMFTTLLKAYAAMAGAPHARHNSSYVCNPQRLA